MTADGSGNISVPISPAISFTDNMITSSPFVKDPPTYMMSDNPSFPPIISSQMSVPILSSESERKQLEKNKNIER